jgi:hypothetical protein
MPTGIIMASSSIGAKQEDIEKVLTANGLEPDKPAVVEPVEPKREDFQSDEEFETAQEEFTTNQEAAREEEEEKKEREAEAARPRKLTRREKAVEHATKKLQDDLRAANERLAALEGKKPAAAPELKAPKREDFKTDEEFEEAKFDYRYKQRRAKEEHENAQKTQQQRLQETLTSYQTSVADFKEDHDDWDEVVNQKIAIHESVYLAIMELKNGPQVTYYLGKHPAEATRLAEMSPLSAAMEVGRLADKLKGGQKPAEGERTPKPKPRLPEPVRPISTAASASTLTSADAAKSGNFKAFKAAQRAGR